MDFFKGADNRDRDLCDLFRSTFAASESAEEGEVIGQLVRDLIDTTAPEDFFVWSAYEDNEIVGAIFLSRITYPQDTRAVFILSPVAIATAHQRRGIGQKLIAHGLDHLRENHADYVMTYGDPEYYIKSGFKQITETFAKAPLALSFAEGWLGQPLSDDGDLPLVGPSHCVPALNKAELW